MKRFLFLIPTLLVLLYACATTETETPVPTSVPNPTVDAIWPLIYNDLNMAIEYMEITTPINQIGHPNGPSYQVTGVEFPQENNVPIRFRVRTRCECAENGSCCESTETFVKIIEALQYNSNIVQQVELLRTVNAMDVWCYDHATLTNKISVPWVDVKNFLSGNITGFQLRAKMSFDPQP